MSFLSNLWLKVLAKLGSVGAFIPLVAEVVKIAIKEQDVVRFQAALDALEAFAQALLKFVAKGREAIQDNQITLVEGSELALDLENIVEEAADIARSL